MHIDGFNDALNVHQIMQQAREERTEEAEAHAPPEPLEIEGEDKESEEQSETGRARGVIRLLESGHFKGVADVRLRINFFDELSARANANAVPVARENAGQLVDAVNGRVDELLGQIELDEETGNTVAEMRREFDTAVQTAVEEATADGKVDTAALGESLNAAFGAFSQQLHDLLAPLLAPIEPEEPEIVPATVEGGESPDEPGEGLVVEGEEPVEDLTEEPDQAAAEVPVEGEPPVEGAVQETPETVTIDLSAAMVTINDAFGEALSGFLASIEEASALPPLSSEPSGNGKAYAKFLAIYNELIGRTVQMSEGIGEPEEPEIDGEDIDLTV